MTRDQLVARAQAFIDLKYVARSDARQKAMGLSYIEAERQDIAREIAAFADAIFAEMAGEWNAAIEAAAKTAYQCEDYGSDAGSMIAECIRALRRPDAAPAARPRVSDKYRLTGAAPTRPATWQHGDPRCDNCDNGQEKEWVFCPFCGHQTKFEDDYGSEAPPRPATPSVEQVARAFYLGMHGRKGADWSANESKDIWLDGAAAVITLFAKERS